MWAQLHNFHITQLFAVFAIHPVSENLCCQFMLKMTCENLLILYLYSYPCRLTLF